MSGFVRPDPRFISPTNDFNRSGGEGTINVNVQPNMNELANRTSTRIFQVASESPETSELLVSSWYRRSGTPFQFTSNIGGPLFRPRLIQLKHVIMPQISNINRKNNKFIIQLTRRLAGTTTRNVNPINVEFEIPVGYYDPDRFLNQLVLSTTDAIVAQLPGNFLRTNDIITSVDVSDVAVTGGYDYESMRFTLDINISSVTYDQVSPPLSGLVLNEPFIFKYWISNTSSFILYGKNMVDFPDAPFQENQPSIGITPGQVEAWTPPSDDAVGRDSDVLTGVPLPTIGPPLISLPGPQFIYSRYVTISSEALSLYAYGESRVDRSGAIVGQNTNSIVNTAGAGGGGGKIIGVASTANYYASNVFFNGANHITAVDAPSIGIKNAQLKLNEFIDFTILDEFGFPLDDAFPADNNWGPTLAFIVSY